MDLEFLQVIMPMLLRGLKVTMEVAVVGILMGFILGSVTGYALQSHSKIARVIANIYIWIIRGTPLVVQALYVYFVVPAIISGIKGETFILDSTLAGIIVITLNAGAFISALVKGALEGVDAGQKEAGCSLGLTKAQVMLHIVIPPAFKSMISVNEITRQTQNYATRTLNTIPAYTVCALFYLVLLSILMILQKVVEVRINK